ncbi:hypothetical protein ACLOJK_035860 [Asimina triloba]
MIKCPSLHPRNPESPAFSHRKSPNPFSIKHRIPGVTVSCVSKGEREILPDDERSRTLARLGTVDSAIEEKNRVLEEKDGSFFSSSGGGGGGGGGGSSDVFERRWPPWENLPERYKLIGTTALAFVICNMDKLEFTLSNTLGHLNILLQSKSRMVGIARMGGDVGEISTAENISSTESIKNNEQDCEKGPLVEISFLIAHWMVLEIGVFIWSLATILVPFVAGYMPGLVFSRILVGIGEGVSPSAATDLIARQEY